MQKPVLIPERSVISIFPAGLSIERFRIHTAAFLRSHEELASCQDEDQSGYKKNAEKEFHKRMRSGTGSGPFFIWFVQNIPYNCISMSWKTRAAASRTKARMDVIVKMTELCMEMNSLFLFAQDSVAELQIGECIIFREIDRIADSDFGLE